MSEGIEVLLIRTISEKLDMKPVFKVIDDAKAFEYITDDEDTGFYADIIKRKVDIMIGGLYDNEVSRRLLSTTIPYDGDEMTWCVIKSGLAPNWMNVFIIFNLELWIIAITTIFISGAVLNYFVFSQNERRENIVWSTIVVLCYSIGIYGPYDPRKMAIRLYVGALCFYGMHFQAAYQSFLLSVLTRPRYDVQVSNIHMAIKDDYRFTGGENLKALFEVSSDDASHYLRNHYQSCMNMDQCLLEIKMDEKLAVAMSRQHAMNAKIPLNNDEMFCFDKADNIFSFSVVMLFKKDHHLLPSMNLYIRRITESGFILKWKLDSEYLKFKEVIKKQFDGDDREKPLTLNHLLGMYLMMCVGISLSIFAFAFEWLVYYLAQKRKILFVQRYFEEKFLLPMPKVKKRVAVKNFPPGLRLKQLRQPIKGKLYHPQHHKSHQILL